MRRLNRNETRLLTLFCAAIFIAANLFGVQFWMKYRAKLARDIVDAEARIAEDRSWLVLAEDFVEPRKWLAANPPPAFTADAASTSLIDSIRSLAEAKGLTMSDEALLPSAGTAAYYNANLQCRLAGPFPGLVHFLLELQKPGAWRSVEKLNVKSDAAPPNVLVEMQIRQYFSDADQPTPTSPP